jgi:hypothetical protein
MIPPVRSNPFDHGVQPPDRAGDWPDFVPVREVPAIAFWLVFLGGVALGIIGACALAWAVLA